MLNLTLPKNDFSSLLRKIDFVGRKIRKEKCGKGGGLS